MMCWRSFIGILILFDFQWTSSAPMLCHLPTSFNKGHCVTTKECTSINLSDSIISPDVFEDFRNRQESCSTFGKNLVCCEITKYASTMEPFTMKTTAAPITSTISISTTSIDTDTKSEQAAEKTDNVTESRGSEFEVQPAELGDIRDHKNYKLFDLKNCGKSFLKRVANGENAEVLEFPWIARLKYQTKRTTFYGCAGTLISEFYILTAAHCVMETNRPIRVRLGEYNATSDKDCNEDMLCADPVQDIEIASIISHPRFDPVKITNDIALIRLAKKAKLSNNNINTICLPFDENSSKKLTPNYQVIGWGATENSSSDPILQKAFVPPVNISECELKFVKIKKLNLNEHQICAGGVAKVDACKGDSGGPLQAPAKVNKQPHIVQFGIVSYGVKTCGEDSYPGIYTKVKEYLHWILDNMS